MSAQNPTGNVTFFFSDIEGSTRMWEDLPAEIAAHNLETHDTILRDGIVAHEGYVIKGTGDGFFAAFQSAARALEACVAIQRLLQGATWKAVDRVKVRMALHTGEYAQFRDGDYFGPVANRTARLLGIGHGDQILVSEATRAVLEPALGESELIDLGFHRLKDLREPMRVWQAIGSGLPTVFPPLRSLRPDQTNLPVLETAIIGREQELADLADLTRKARLVTLTGSGGTGKTRLMLQFGSDSVERHVGGVWLAEFAEVPAGGRLDDRIAEAVGVAETPERSAIEAAIARIGSEETLLLLDNCEHVIEDAARLARRLLERCPCLRMLATSREPLAIPSEQVYRVPSLPTPEPDRRHTPAAALEFSSVRLFLDLAARARPGFALSEANVDVVCRLCARLDGIPLALELAAARVRGMTIEQIESKLDEMFRLLAGGTRGRLPRQQTLRALIDWSWDLLSEAERTALARLSVFAGGWSLEAARQVCGDDDLDDWAVEDHLAALVDKSLVILLEDGQPRYRFLNPIRAYAEEKLDPAAREETRRRHAAYFLDWARSNASGLQGPNQAEGLKAFDLDRENLRAAIRCLAATSDRDSALALANHCKGYWLGRSRFREAREELERLTEGETPVSEALADAKNLLGSVCLFLGDLVAATERYGEAMAAFESLALPGRTAGVLNNLCYVSTEQGRFAEARGYAERALNLYGAAPDPPSEANLHNNLGRLGHLTKDHGLAREFFERARAHWSGTGNRIRLAAVLNNLGAVAFDQGDRASAHDYYAEALTVARDVGDRRQVGICLMNLGELLVQEGDLAAADANYREAIEIQRDLDDRPGLAHAFEGLAIVRLEAGDAEAAADLWGRAVGLRRETGVALGPNREPTMRRFVEACRTNLGDERFQLLVRSGSGDASIEARRAAERE
ncbi:MAG: tetratricopeptide repeat protein [Fimbriimonadaceae bacterium]|nr:tetratricopeptide repeat protein [Fimbriimonadaceae bacterium]